MARVLWLLTALLSEYYTVCALQATVFGATGGVGQLICRNLIADGYTVRAITRNVAEAMAFDNLKDCNLIEADARNPLTLENTLDSSDVVVINIGTTAFPTKKWKNGNNPIETCVTAVNNILNEIQRCKSEPRAVVLLSSVGVERPNAFPFRILNSFGILDAKLRSENMLFEKCKEFRKTTGIVVRPGRLVGPPFTNFDVARLLGITQGLNKGIVVDKRDVLLGDVERRDVASAITKLLKLPLIPKQQIRFSIVNAPGESPSNQEWTALLKPLIESSTSTGTYALNK